MICFGKIDFQLKSIVKMLIKTSFCQVLYYIKNRRLFKISFIFSLSNDMYIMDDGKFWTFRLPRTTVLLVSWRKAMNKLAICFTLYLSMNGGELCMLSCRLRRSTITSGKAKLENRIYVCEYSTCYGLVPKRVIEFSFLTHYFHAWYPSVRPYVCPSVRLHVRPVTETLYNGHHV